MNVGNQVAILTDLNEFKKTSEQKIGDLCIDSNPQVQM